MRSTVSFVGSTWTATEREPHRVVVEHILYPQPGYPFLLGISIEYALSHSGLQVRTTATNLGTQSCPYVSIVSRLRLALQARIRLPDGRLPYHQIARARRARGDRGKCRTNSSLHDSCRYHSDAKCRN